MKYNLIVLLIFFVFSSPTNAQNLIPNGDFEEYSVCPTFSGEIDKLLDWFDPMEIGSPEYFNSCVSLLSTISVPKNSLGGYQSPQSGNGFLGLILYRGLGVFVREFASVRLDSKLEKDACYEFQMYVNLANNSQYGINSIGVHFSDSLVVEYPSHDVPFEPQIEQETIITDTLDWTLIQGTIQAKGSEHYIMIGNFRNDSEVDVVQVSNSLFGHAYLLFDNISLIKVDCNEYIVPNQDIIIYPNPASSQLNVKIENQAFASAMDIKLFSSTGLFLSAIKIEGKDIYTWDISYLPEGIYFLEIVFLGENIFGRLLKLTSNIYIY